MRAHVFIAGCLLIVAALGLATYAAFRDVRNGVRFVVCVALFTGLALMFEERLTEIDFPFGGGLKQVTAQAVTDAGAIAALRERVENQSATVDLVAGKAAKAESKLLDAQQRVDELGKAVVNATTTIERLQNSAWTTTLIADAQNDDRAALDELKQISEDRSNPDSSKAEAAWHTITLSAYTFLQLEFKVPWLPSVDPTKLTFDQLKYQYDHSENQYVRMATLEYIATRKDIDLGQRLDFFVAVAGADKSIKDCVFAQKQVALAAPNARLQIFDQAGLVAWWAEHRSEFIGKQ